MGTGWLITTGCTYVLSQAVALRAFRSILPEEDRFYDDLEELLMHRPHDVDRDNLVGRGPAHASSIEPTAICWTCHKRSSSRIAQPTWGAPFTPVISYAFSRTS